MKVASWLYRKRRDFQMIIDSHHHVVNEDGYIERLISIMDELGIEKVCISALGPFFKKLFLNGKEPCGIADNFSVLRAMETYPERIIGFGTLFPGIDSPEVVDELYQKGFRALKITLPMKNYNDPEFFPIYEKAEGYRMPILFHTGILTLPEPVPGILLSSGRMRPVYLDTIANRFPDLVMIIAHLGMPWYEEAASLARIYPNIYVDISGKIDGWRCGKSLQFFKEVFYWKGAYEKILFGSDVHCEELEITLEDQMRILRGIGFDEAERALVLGGNFKRIWESLGHSLSTRAEILKGSLKVEEGLRKSVGRMRGVSAL